MKRRQLFRLKTEKENFIKHKSNNTVVEELVQIYSTAVYVVLNSICKYSLFALNTSLLKASRFNRMYKITESILHVPSLLKCRPK